MPLFDTRLQSQRSNSTTGCPNSVELSGPLAVMMLPPTVTPGQMQVAPHASMVRASVPATVASRPWSTPALPRMTGDDRTLSLDAVLFGGTRRRALGWLLGHADQAYDLRQIARLTGAGLGAVQRELEQLTAAGRLQRTARGRQAYFQANRARLRR